MSKKGSEKGQKHRKALDCREYPSETECSIRMEGEEDELVEMAAMHAVKTHGEKDGPELRSWLREHMRDVS